MKKGLQPQETLARSYQGNAPISSTEIGLKNILQGRSDLGWWTLGVAVRQTDSLLYTTLVLSGGVFTGLMDRSVPDENRSPPPRRRLLGAPCGWKDGCCLESTVTATRVVGWRHSLPRTALSSEHPSTLKSTAPYPLKR